MTTFAKVCRKYCEIKINNYNRVNNKGEKDMYKYRRLLEDITFKYIFGYQKNVQFTEWLLENLFSLKNGSLKGRVIILNSPKLEKIDQNGYNLELDIVIEVANKIINLEAYTNGFDKTKAKKSLLYLSALFGTQLQMGSSSRRTKEVQQINFIEKSRKESGNYLLMKIDGEKEEFVKGMLSVDILNIDRYSKSGYNNNENMEKLFKLMGVKTRKEAREIVKGNKVLEEMEEKIERFTKEEWFQKMFGMAATYEFYMREERADLEDKLEKTAELKLKEGAKREKVETAKNLLNDGMSLEKIKKYTGLSKSEIEAIKI